MGYRDGSKFGHEMRSWDTDENENGTCFLFLYLSLPPCPVGLAMSVFRGPMERLERALPLPGSAGYPSAAARTPLLPGGSGSCPAPQCRGHQPCPAPPTGRVACEGASTEPLGCPGAALARPRPRRALRGARASPGTAGSRPRPRAAGPLRPSFEKKTVIKTIRRNLQTYLPFGIIQSS
ncbi:dapper homolog 3-like isoform X2 [Vidua macroura]|uniref:dapper homolog 3-like isoform X2 n=1 Tax=Vidua macroura TaxID=187451 RepID=UPI0023A88821|nr:dapper homolog 3-like isoform X2 [Vidua macroura]